IRQLRQRLSYRLADDVTMTDQLAIRRVRELEDMLWPTEYAHEPRRLSKKLSQTGAFVSKLKISLSKLFCQNVLSGHVVADHKHAADLVLDVDGAIPIGPPYVLTPAVTRHWHKLIDVPCGAFAGHNEFNLGPNDVPDLHPTIITALAERTRVTFRPHGLPVGVVIKLDQLRSPPDEHRVLAGEQKANRGF